MIKSILIANRGEIACRIIETARKLNIKTVVVYSDADAHSLAVQLGDESYRLGPADLHESYLNIPKIIDIARRAKVEAIHPGYGFLSENTDFAKACLDNGLIFIGPSLEALEKMGSKSEAKKIATLQGVPIIPGFEGDLINHSLSYPLIVKAVMGGGGKGMRVVSSTQDLLPALEACEREALAYFGDGSIFLEKYIEKPRHIEVQIFGDSQGSLVHLFERDCTLQRRHQKIIEETPSNLPTDIKEKLYEAALKIGKAINYEGAGTVEFLVDPQGQFYFMEMNTRLQVEHPITESITGLDLVEWQIRVASGEGLPLSQKDIKSSGHAIELRLYAEDPKHYFKPSPGPLWMPLIPDNIRIDTGFKPKDIVTSYYDSLIAKIIVKSKNRQDALEKAKDSLSEFPILGLITNASFLQKLLGSQDIIQNHYDVGYIDQNLKELSQFPPPPYEVFLAGSLIKLLEGDHPQHTPWEDTHNWRLLGNAPQRFEWTSGDIAQTVSLTYTDGDWISDQGHRLQGELFENKLHLFGQDILFWDMEKKLSLYYKGDTYILDKVDFSVEAKEKREEHLKAPMTGKVILISVNEGELVKEGQPILVLEAMKMEHVVRAPKDGHIKTVFYKVGDVVNEGLDLFEMGEIHGSA